MPLFRLGDKQPQLGDNAWVAPNATLIGDIRLGANASIWWNATLRGDNDPIHIGDNTNIQDGSVLHTDEGVPMHIGNNVTVGHLVMDHRIHPRKRHAVVLWATRNWPRNAMKQSFKFRLNFRLTAGLPSH